MVAADPATLEVAIVNHEEKIKQRRLMLTKLLPALGSIASEKPSFMVHTYQGEEGLKQMFWHELQTRGEVVVLGGLTMEALITNHRWAERFRGRIVEAGYRTREIINHDVEIPVFTNNQNFISHYEYRRMPSEFIYFNEQTSVYNNTVAIYHWREDRKVGIEIVSESYANMMRTIFEHFWQLAKEDKNTKT